MDGLPQPLAEGRRADVLMWDELREALERTYDDLSAFYENLKALEELAYEAEERRERLKDERSVWCRKKNTVKRSYIAPKYKVEAKARSYI